MMCKENKEEKKGGKSTLMKLLNLHHQKFNSKSNVKRDKRPHNYYFFFPSLLCYF